MRMYNEIENNVPAPLDSETLTTLSSCDNIPHNSGLSYGSTISENLNIEIPKEWFGPSG
ncbi:hypothetical protein DSO57_1029165 [Entomophthora muscae]|uniref:Uncharacterized protein n=1 Tax=Entomophthora muscae TaxID=34485 RepID=A0ACC2RFX8_9FUNG|nr:hypothetical protein DSO57_1029165 [Entomophthora muscae]